LLANRFLFAFAAIFAKCMRVFSGACAGHISFWDAADRNMDVAVDVDEVVLVDVDVWLPPECA